MKEKLIKINTKTQTFSIDCSAKINRNNLKKKLQENSIDFKNKELFAIELHHFQFQGPNQDVILISLMELGFERKSSYAEILKTVLKSKALMNGQKHAIKTCKVQTGFYAALSSISNLISNDFTVGTSLVNSSDPKLFRIYKSEHGVKIRNERLFDINEPYFSPEREFIFSF